MDSKVREQIEKKIEEVEKQGHGEVVIKIKNGFIHRVLTTIDELLAK